MFYCTIYKKSKIKDSWTATFCLAYASEADAKNFAAVLAEQAVDCGAQVDEQDNAYVITGPAYLGLGGFSKYVRNTFYYLINVEDYTSRFSISPDTEINGRYIEDGYKFEERVAEYRDRVFARHEKEREKINYNLSRFEQEIANETNLTKILTSLLKVLRLNLLNK